MDNTVELHDTDQGQIICLPPGYRLPGPRVTVRREGNAVVLEPLVPAGWPEKFFESIRIDDPAFQRPDQGTLPPIVSLDS
jgi:antitoxin VapB